MLSLGSNMTARLSLRLASLLGLFFSAATAMDYYSPQPSFCAPGGGCETVRYSEIGLSVGLYLPLLGLFFFSALFGASLVMRTRTLKWAAYLGVSGGVGGLVLVALQGFLIGAYCELCLGADIAGIWVGASGVWLLLVPEGERTGHTSIMSPWWAVWSIAVFTLPAWAATFPDPPVPETVQSLWDDGRADVVEFVDFECAYCRALHPSLKAVLDGASDDVNFVRVVVPLRSHRNARTAAAAYQCARQQGQGEAMADRLFEAEDNSREGTLEGARELSLEMEAFSRCLDDDATDVVIDADLALFDQAGLRSLPVVYIGHRQLLGFSSAAGAMPYQAALDAALAGEGRRIRWQPFTSLVLTVLLLGLVPLRIQRKKG